MNTNVRAYGAVGDGLADDTLAFRNALAAIRDSREGGECFVPNGTYRIGAGGITTGLNPALATGMHLIGESRENSIIKVDVLPTNNIIQCNGDEWSIENLRIDMFDFSRGTGDSTPSNPIRTQGDRWKIKDCDIIRHGKFGMVIHAGTGWTIEGCYIYKTTPTAQPCGASILVTTLGAQYPQYGRIYNNNIDGSSCGLFGSYHLIHSNRINRTGCGSGIFLGANEGTHHTFIIGNECALGIEGYDDSQGGVWFQVTGMEVWSPDSLIYNNKVHDNCGGGILVGGQNTVCAYNECYDNGRGQRGRSGIVGRCIPAKNRYANGSVIIGNHSWDTQPAGSKTQIYGYEEQSGVSGVRFGANDFDGNKLGTHLFSGSRWEGVNTALGLDAYRTMILPKLHDLLAILEARQEPGLITELL